MHRQKVRSKKECNTIPNTKGGLKSRSADKLKERDVEVTGSNVPEQLPWLPDISASLAVTVSVAALYIKTLHPSVPGGDAGEIIAAAHELGVAHPPGYPLFTLMAWLAIKFIPVGSVAWRVNLINALVSALASGLLMLTTLRLSSSFVPAGLVAVAMFSISKLPWLWATGAEVFSLNNFFTSAILMSCVYLEGCPRREKNLIACLGAFLCGLSLCNQHTIVIYVAVAGLWVLYHLKSAQTLSVLSFLTIALYGALGLVPYIHLPASSLINQSRWTWGNQSSWSGFMTHLLRVEYGTFDLGKESVGSGFLLGIREYCRHLLQDMLYIGPVFAGVALLIAVRRLVHKQGSSLFIFIVMLMVYVTFFTWRANLDLEKPLFRGVVERFWLQSDVVVAILAGVGFYAVFRIICWGKDMSVFVKTFAWILSIAAVTLQLHFNYKFCDQSSNKVVHEFGTTILDSMPKNAVIFTKGDLPSNSLRYLHLCERYRPDITIFDVEVMSYRWSLPMLAKFYPRLVFPGDYWHLETKRNAGGLSSFNFKHLLDVNYKLHPMFVCIGMQDRDPSWTPQYHLIPFGVCDRVAKTNSVEFNVTDWYNMSKNIARHWRYPFDTFPATSWERVANNDMWHAKINMAFFMYSVADNVKDEEEKLSLYLHSYKLYKRAIKAHSDIGFPDHWHKNYALVCQKLLRYEDMHKLKTSMLLKQSLDHFQSYVAKTTDDPQIDAIKNVISYLKKQLEDLDSKESCSAEEKSKSP